MKFFKNKKYEIDYHFFTKKKDGSLTMRLYSNTKGVSFSSLFKVIKSSSICLKQFNNFVNIDNSLNDCAVYIETCKSLELFIIS